MFRSRRSVLRAGVSFGSIDLAGCIAEPDGMSSDDTPTETTSEGEEMPNEIKLWFEQVSLSESKRSSIDPIVFTDLSEKQREIVQTAIEEGEYTEQLGEESVALSSLKARVAERSGGGVEVYLRRDDSYYRVGLVAGDHIIASP